ncbi:hypothetical protein MTO96_015174 [Rhipicephalus appendiculatus]|uniref:8.9 kDa family member n=1 Tax=Rhipicephalus appendiculatus TaxID=34631 RepID=A0A131Z7D9_RHIAP
MRLRISGVLAVAWLVSTCAADAPFNPTCGGFLSFKQDFCHFNGVDIADGHTGIFTYPCAKVYCRARTKKVLLRGCPPPKNTSANPSFFTAWPSCCNEQ